MSLFMPSTLSLSAVARMDEDGPSTEGVSVTRVIELLPAVEALALSLSIDFLASDTLISN